MVQEACGNGHLEKLVLLDQRTGETEEVGFSHRMFIFIGAEPRTDWLGGVVARDDHGFVLAGPDLRNVCGWMLERPPHHLETSVPGVFCRGRCARGVSEAGGRPPSATVRMAVMLVHRYLADA